MNSEIQEQLASALATMQEILGDRTIPRNVKRVVEAGVTKLKDQSEDISVSIATTVYDLEEIAGDINIPSHARTFLWTIISSLENIKEKLL
jgi:uncharacterized protein (UPF0147 family)